VTIDLEVSAVHDVEHLPHLDEHLRSGFTRVDVNLSCLGLGPINTSRLRRINNKFAGRLRVGVMGDAAFADGLAVGVMGDADFAPDKDSEDNWVPESEQETKQNQFCTSCGEQLGGEGKFCGSCGTKA
jgi:hypothetical protein